MRSTDSGWPTKVLVVLGGTIVSTLAIALAWMWTGGAQPTAQTGIGRQVYAQHCAACHGANLEGQDDWRTRRPDGRLPAPPHDVTGHTWHHTPEQLFGIVKHGVEAFAPPGYKSDMPAYANILSDDEIRAVLAFIESSWPEHIRQRRQQMLSRSR